jgi:hypothetical protein
MFTVIAYYTKNTIYENIIENLRRTINQFNIPNKIIGIDSLGSWQKNTHYKPIFIRQMLDEFEFSDLVYVDADAEFMEYPHYFNELSTNPNVNISVLELDHSKYRRKTRGLEILSGTIFLKNSSTTRTIIDDWIKECKLNPDSWDQVTLSNTLKKHEFFNLPERYCVIFDYMASVQNPVIKHFQASRQARVIEKQKAQIVNVPSGHIRIKKI